MNLNFDVIARNIDLGNLFKPDVVSMFTILSILAVPFIMAFAFLGLMNLLLNKNQSIAKRLSLMICGAVYIVALFTYAFNLALLSNPTKYEVNSTKTAIIVAMSLIIAILLKIFGLNYDKINNNDENSNENKKEIKNTINEKRSKIIITIFDKIKKYYPIFIIILCIVKYNSIPAYIILPILVGETIYFVLKIALEEKRKERILEAITPLYSIWIIIIMATRFF